MTNKPDIDNLTEKIIILSRHWYDLVSKNHHKDRDCHWYIETDYQYGDKPIYTAWHRGYQADDLPSKMGHLHYYLAQQDLLGLIVTAFYNQEAWVNDVLTAGESEWDVDQIEFAKYWRSVEDDFRKAKNEILSI